MHCPQLNIILHDGSHLTMPFGIEWASNSCSANESPRCVDDRSSVMMMESKMMMETPTPAAHA
jgi:hypothetical protein